MNQNAQIVKMHLYLYLYPQKRVLVLHYTYSADTVVTNMTFSSVKPSISPSNIALNANPGTVLKSAHPEDSKTVPVKFDKELPELIKVKDKV